MKIAKATRRLPTPWNWAAAQWLRSSSVLKERGPLRTGLRPQVGRPKKLGARAERHIQMLSLKDRRRNAVSIAAEIEGVRGQPVSAQTICRTLHQIDVHCCHPRRKPLLKMIHKKARKQFAEDMSTKNMDYWNHVIWSDEMKINLFCSDGFKHVWRWPGEEYKDKCIMPTVVGMSWSGAAWVLQVLESYISLRETWTPTCTVKYCSRAWSPPSRNWVAGQCSSMTMAPKHTSKTTTALLKRLMVKVTYWPSMSPDLNLREHLWVILKRKVEVCKVWNIRQLRDVVMEDWKNIPVAPCEALVNSMPSRVKAVLDNDGGHTKHWQLTWWMLILTTFPKGCTHFCWQGFRF